MRLLDLEPRWGIKSSIAIGGVMQHFADRRGMAVTFWCPCCLGTDRSTRLGVWFVNPMDGLPPTDDAKCLWQRTGDTLETLTLSPSIDASAHGHWHGFIVNGEVK